MGVRRALVMVPTRELVEARTGVVHVVSGRKWDRTTFHAVKLTRCMRSLETVGGGRTVTVGTGGEGIQGSLGRMCRQRSICIHARDGDHVRAELGIDGSRTRTWTREAVAV